MVYCGLLVGGLEHFIFFIIFPYIGKHSPPFDFHIFQRGRSTTSQVYYGFYYVT